MNNCTEQVLPDLYWEELLEEAMLRDWEEKFVAFLAEKAAKEE